MKRVSFWGSSVDAVPALMTLASHHRILSVVTSPDKPCGRGCRLTPSPVKEVALSLGIPRVFTPERLDEEFRRLYLDEELDIGVVVSYGKMIPTSLLDHPRWGTLNLHFSLLPRWRGASPVESAVLNGDAETGVTVMRLVKELDAGPLFCKRVLPLGKDDFAEELRISLAEIGAEETLSVVDRIENLSPVEQPREGITLCGKIGREEGLLSPLWTALQVHRRIRAFTPWPSVYTLFRGKRLQLTNSELLGETERSDLPPSRVVEIDKRGILLSCAQGTLLRITQVKPECKKAMSARDFAQGARLLCGEDWASCLKVREEE